MRLLPALTVALLATLAALPALAQRPVATEKPWPHVALQEFFDPTKAIPSLGKTRAPREEGDCIMDLRNAADGSNRLFLVTRKGVIYILQNGKLLPDPLLDISNLTTMDGERGLLSLAFPPNFKTSQHFYVLYTASGRPRGNVTLARYQIDPKNPNRALPDSAQILLTITHTQYSNHNGGQIAFGPNDGDLYWSIGDGGAGYDPNFNAQNLSSYLGKILRLDVEGKPDDGKPYRIPTDNPFLNNPAAKPEIWAIGLRNPFRFSFDSLNGDLYIGNVGQDQWEEIYYTPGTSKGGENYGWSIVEGTHSTVNDAHQKQTPGTTTPITFPVAEFSHKPQGFISITGGYVYRAAEFPDWKGTYFFSDWIKSQIWALRRDANGQWQTRQVDGPNAPAIHPVSFGTDEKGTLFITSFADGKIYKLIQAAAEE